MQLSAFYSPSNFPYISEFFERRKMKMIFEEIWIDDDEFDEIAYEVNINMIEDEYLKDLEHEDALDYGEFFRIED